MVYLSNKEKGRTKEDEMKHVSQQTVSSTRSQTRIATCTIQSTPGMSSPRAATSVHSRIPFDRDVNVASAFSLEDYIAKKNQVINTKTLNT